MKYDIKKMEEVVYDISLRGLVNKPSSTAGSVAANNADDTEMPGAKRVSDA